MKKYIVLMLTLTIMLNILPVQANPINIPTGTNAAAINPNHVFGSVIFGEFVGSNNVKIESFYVELYAKEEKLATTVLEKANTLNTSSISWHILIEGEKDEYWTTTWVDNNPVGNKKPTHVVTYVNGVNVGETPIQYNYDGGVIITDWADMPGVKVARIKDTYYTSVQEAIDAAKVGETVTLLSDVSNDAIDGDIDTHFHFDKDDNMIFDLNGHIVTGAFFVKENAIVTLKNGSIRPTTNVSPIESEGYLTLHDVITSSIRHGLRISGGTALINGDQTSITTIAASSTTHAINISGDAFVTINGGTFTGASIKGGGSALAIRGDNSKVIINDGVFTNKEGDYTLGLWGGDIVIKGGIFHKAQMDTLNIGGIHIPSGKEEGIMGGLFEEEIDEQLIAEGKVSQEIVDSTSDYNGWYKVVSVLTPNLESQKRTYTGKQVNYELDGYSIKYMQGNQEVTPKNVGFYDVIVTKEATDTTAAFKAKIENGLQIIPAKLTATYKSEVVNIGKTPLFKVEVTGFVGEDTPESLTGYVIPTVSSNEMTVGTYACMPSGGNPSENYYFEYVSGNLHIIENKVDYHITKGHQQSITIGEEATFISNADFDKFVCVLVDGIEIDPSHYTLTSGSTKVTLKKEFIENLRIGKHTITIVSLDGDAETTFEVKEKVIVNPNDKNDEIQKEEIKGPNTGDTSSLTLWVLLVLISSFVSVGTLLLRREEV